MILFCWLLGISLGHGVIANIQLIQPSSEIKKPGESIKLSCKTSGFVLTSVYMHWIQQVPGKGLTWIGRIDPEDGGTKYASSFTGRFVITTNNSVSTVYLDITSLKVEDTATYYCASGYSYFDYWGQGTMVTVTSAEKSSPSLFPLISYGKSEDSVAIGCLAKDFLPGDINFSWLDKSNNSITSGVRNFPSMMQSSTATFCASTQLNVPSNSWNNMDPFYCVAKHGDTNKSRQIVKRETLIRSPVISIHPPLKDTGKTHNLTTIVCIAREYSPRPVIVKWLKKGQEVKTGIKTDNMDQDSDRLFETASYISIAKKDWDSDITFSCVVEHPASSFFDMKNVSKSQVCDTPSTQVSVEVYAIPPSFASIFDTKVAKLTCLVTNIVEKYDEINISWYKVNTKNENLKTTIETPIYHDNSTFSVEGIATVCADDWMENKFLCIVKHPQMASSKEVKLSKEQGEMLSPPSLYLYPPHQEELAKNEAITFICLVKGFSPDPVFVKWFEKDVEVDNSSYKTTSPMEELYNGKKTYYLYSMLTLSNADNWKSGSSYTCVVGHESLPLQMIQRSIDKSSGKPTSVNVTLNLSDTY